MSCLTECYQEEKRQTINSLIRVQTPYPPKKPSVQLMIDACAPCRCLESVGLITCGSLLWLIPCTVCRLKTQHYQNNVTVESCCLYPRCKKPNPIGYEDRLYQQGSNNYTHSEGYQINCQCGQTRPEGSVQIPTHVTSTMTGFQLIHAGIQKLIDTAENFFCLPCHIVNCCRQ